MKERPTKLKCLTIDAYITGFILGFFLYCFKTNFLSIIKKKCTIHLGFAWSISLSILFLYGNQNVLKCMFVLDVYYYTYKVSRVENNVRKNIYIF